MSQLLYTILPNELARDMQADTKGETLLIIYPYRQYTSLFIFRFLYSAYAAHYVYFTFRKVDSTIIQSQLLYTQFFYRYGKALVFSQAVYDGFLNWWSLLWVKSSFSFKFVAIVEYLNRIFVHFLVNTIESQEDNEEEEEENLIKIFVSLILSFNQHFEGR